MAIKTPGLIMALVAIVTGFAGENTVISEKIGIMVGRDAFPFVAVIAVLDCHFGIFLVSDLLCKRKLLEIHQDASQDRY